MSTVALDRQIRPIYDSLDTGSNKSAVVACNKLLKKHPKNELVKALKTLALVRSQKIEESLSLCDEILESKPTNDAVLTAMMHVLRGLGRHNDMVKMFEEAYKKQPGNEELGAQTFFANVRAQHWKSAQQIATRMYKSFQEDRYLYWSVMSAVLQANDMTTPQEMRVVLYKLAHRLITSSPTPSYLNADRFHLHLSILRELRLFDEAVTLLESDVGKSICATSLCCNEVRRDIFRLNGMMKAEGDRAEQLIVEKKDRNWLEFLSLIDATFAYDLSSNATEQPTSESEQRACLEHILKTRKIFTNIVEEDGARDRSGLLALLELEKRARMHGFSSETGQMVILLEQYFEAIGDKACCFEDLKPYVVLEGDDSTRWSQYLKSVPSDFATVHGLRRLINSCKLLRYTLPSSEINMETEMAHVALYIQVYFKGLALGSSLPSTELQPSDDLALLAANGLVTLWTLSNDEHFLFNAATFLEYVLSKSKQSFLTRLILIRIYRLLGAPALALEHYRDMQIKQIQHDTMSHFILSRASTFSTAATGDLTFATECLESTQIYMSNSQETNEFIVRAFTSEKYSQIPEFISFECQLDNSLQRDIVKMEHLRMRLTHEPINSDIVDMELIELKFIFDRTHYDNRDFSILMNYQPLCSKSLEEQTQLFGKSEQSGWLWMFLKIYIRAFQQSSDLDDVVEERLLIGDRPKQAFDVAKRIPLKERLAQRQQEELANLTIDEAKFIAFADALADWLEVYHNYTRPPPAVVLAEAAKQTELKTGHPLKGIELPLNGSASGVTKKDEEPPAVREPPELLTTYFNDLRNRFAEAERKSSPAEALHVAALGQEALLLFIVETMRFRSPSLIKVNKFGGLVSHIKEIRSNAIATLKDISSIVLQRSDLECNADQRNVVLEASANLRAYEVDADFISGVGRKILDSRKKLLEGVGRGIVRICASYA